MKVNAFVKSIIDPCGDAFFSDNNIKKCVRFPLNFHLISLHINNFADSCCSGRNQTLIKFSISLYYCHKLNYSESVAVISNSTHFFLSTMSRNYDALA